MIRPFLILICLAGAAGAQHAAPYAGQDAREIAALSADDIAKLEAGDGWGLALPAELNGWPGPRHVLDMAAALELSAEQLAEVQGLWDRMNAAARADGARLIAAERALDTAFALGEIDAARLTALLAEAEAARAALREVHLRAHLDTAPLLSRHQKRLYAQARGYGDGAGDHQGHGGH